MVCSSFHPLFFIVLYFALHFFVPPFHCSFFRGPFVAALDPPCVSAEMPHIFLLYLADHTLANVEVVTTPFPHIRTQWQYRSPSLVPTLPLTAVPPILDTCSTYVFFTVCRQLVIFTPSSTTLSQM